MKNLPSDIRLTDELERQLMMQAIDEQFRFKPTIALKDLWVKVTNLFTVARTGHTPIKVG